MSAEAVFAWRGHELLLLAERAVWDPAQRLLLVADLHLGKAETFQAHGIPLPSDGDAATLNRLLALAHRWQPRQLLVLGDLLHGRLGLTSELRAKLAALPELLGCRLRLVAGNHERGSWIADLPQEPSQQAGPLWFSHGPELPPDPGLLNVCGHVHPVAVVGQGADRLRLPCFAHDSRQPCLVLPAFGELTGGHRWEQCEQIWLVADGAIVPWTTRPCARGRRSGGLPSPSVSAG
jgi:DNA ligase-associated metallophosphoesterase